MLAEESQLLFATNILDDQLLLLVELVMLKSIGVLQNPGRKTELHQLAYLVDTLDAMCRHRDLLKRHLNSLFPLKQVIVALDCLCEAYIRNPEHPEREYYDLRVLLAKLCLIIANLLLVNTEMFSKISLLDLDEQTTLDPRIYKIFTDHKSAFDPARILLNVLLLVQELSIDHTSDESEHLEVPESKFDAEFSARKGSNPSYDFYSIQKDANCPLNTQKTRFKYLIAPARLLFLLLYKPEPQYLQIPGFGRILLRLINLAIYSIKNIIWCYFKASNADVHEPLLVELLKCVCGIFQNYGLLFDFYTGSPSKQFADSASFCTPENVTGALYRHLSITEPPDSLAINDIHIIFVFLAKLLSLDRKFAIQKFTSPTKNVPEMPWSTIVDLLIVLYKNFASLLLSLPYPFYDNLFFESDLSRQHFNNDSLAVMRTLFLYYSTKPIQVFEIVLVGYFSLIRYELERSNGEPAAEKSKKKGRKKEKDKPESPPMANPSASIMDSITQINHEHFFLFLSLISYFLKYRNYLKNDTNVLKHQLYGNRIKQAKKREKRKYSNDSKTHVSDDLQFDQTVHVFQRLNFVNDFSDFFERLLTPIKNFTGLPRSSDRKNSVSSGFTDLLLFRNIPLLKLLRENELKPYHNEEVHTTPKKTEKLLLISPLTPKMPSLEDQDDEDFNSIIQLKLGLESEKPAPSALPSPAEEPLKEALPVDKNLELMLESKKKLGTAMKQPEKPKKTKKITQLRKSKSTGILRLIQSKIRPTEDPKSLQPPQIANSVFQTPPRKSVCEESVSGTPILFDPQRLEEALAPRSGSVCSSGRKGSLSTLFKTLSNTNPSSPFRKIGGLSPKAQKGYLETHRGSPKMDSKGENSGSLSDEPKLRSTKGPMKQSISKKKKELRELLLILACDEMKGNHEWPFQATSVGQEGRKAAFQQQALVRESNCYRVLMKCCKNPFVNATIKLLIVEIYFNLITEHVNEDVKIKKKKERHRGERRELHRNSSISSFKAEHHNGASNLERAGERGSLSRSSSYQKLDFATHPKHYFNSNLPFCEQPVLSGQSARVSVASSSSNIDEMTNKATTINDFFLKFQNLKHLQLFLLIFMSNDLFYLIFLFFQDNIVIDVSEEELRIITNHLRARQDHSMQPMSVSAGRLQELLVFEEPEATKFDAELYQVSDDEAEFVDRSFDRERARRLASEPKLTLDIELDYEPKRGLGLRSSLVTRTKSFLTGAKARDTPPGPTFVPRQAPDPTLISKFDNFSFPKKSSSFSYGGLDKAGMTSPRGVGPLDSVEESIDPKKRVGDYPILEGRGLRIALSSKDREKTFKDSLKRILQLSLTPEEKLQEAEKFFGMIEKLSRG